jgi:glutamate-ammonia-ligase adenylyltransferase
VRPPPSAVAARLRRSLAGTPLAAAADALARQLAEAPGADALAAAPDAVFAGFARAAAASPEQARFALRRRSLLARAAELDPGWLARRAAALEDEAGTDPTDLEGFLDGLRLLRREDMFLAACVDFGGVAPFEEVSRFLSSLAEAVARRALRAASRSLPEPDPELAVVAMGKLGGREFTYHSDLDLIFLHGGGVEAVPGASRVAQRLISYVTTMTGAGMAYAVDSRLRPSGKQGMLVTSFDGFIAYQSEAAATWESLALVRARPIAGAVAPTEAALDRIHARVFGRGPGVWPEIAAMRRRVERERTADEARGVELKLGPGGLMDAEFLAEGGVLELGRDRARAPLPSVPALLRATAGDAAAAAPLAHYAFLRRVESRLRWCAGRADERLDPSHARLDAMAELVEPGLAPAALLERIAAARAGLRAAWNEVVTAGTIRALAAADPGGR